MNVGEILILFAAGISVGASCVIIWRVWTSRPKPIESKGDAMNKYFLQTYRLGMESVPVNSCTEETSQPDLSGAFDFASEHEHSKTGDVIFIINVETSLIEGICRMEWDHNVMRIEIEPAAINKKEMSKACMNHLMSRPQSSVVIH